jgi:hypothetical protein
MLPASLAERICRMSLLEPHRVEMIHPLARAHRVIGWSIKPDEHWSVGDGYMLIKTIEAAAELDFAEILNRYRLTGTL